MSAKKPRKVKERQREERRMQKDDDGKGGRIREDGERLEEGVRNDAC